VCKKCRHGVIPSQIQSHLQRVHRVKLQQAEVIAERVGSWPGVAEYASEIAVPREAVPLINELQVYTDGLLCQVEPRCRQILRSKGEMRNHWKTAHSWSVAGKGGRPSRVTGRRVQARIQQGAQAVYCQRLFVQGQGSQYLEVQPPDNDDPAVVPIPGR
jgi:hypothetical protein